MASSKTSGWLPRVNPRNVGRSEVAVVLRLQQMLVWKVSLKRVDCFLEPVGCH